MLDPDVYVNVHDMINTHSKDILFVKLGMPTTQTLFVDLVDFSPAVDNSLSNGSDSRSHHNGAPPSVSHSRTPPLPSNGSGSGSISMRGSQSAHVLPPAHIQPPPPPWSLNPWSR